ncbi:MAG: enoyl-CoA hydratase [Actinomycetota bacterium]|nr:enoyl-CoA hydratase [Actinomycetota bacterium]
MPAQLVVARAIAMHNPARHLFLNIERRLVTYQAMLMPCTVQLVTGQIHIRRDGHIGVIVLDHAERHNAISAEMWQGLLDSATELAADQEIRAVLIRGEGTKAFAAGADISEFSNKRTDSSTNRDYDNVSDKAYVALATMPKPLVAMIHGYCIGGGLAVALTADLRIVSDDAKFTIPAARLGLGYRSEGLGKLVQLIGPSATKRIMFLADRFGAEEALTMGLVNRVVPKAELEEATSEWMNIICQNAPLTIRAAKAATDEWAKPESLRDFGQINDLVNACFDSADYREGVEAFMSKRTPRFSGD